MKKERNNSRGGMGGSMTELQNIEERLARIEDVLQSLQLPQKEKYFYSTGFYSTGEVAERLGLSKWYVRRLCSLGEIKAEKQPENMRFPIPASEPQRILCDWLIVLEGACSLNFCS